MNIENLVRPNIKRLKPYRSAREEFDGKADIFLDANENSMGSTVGQDLNRYPDPMHRNLKAELSRHKNVSANRIFVGNGSDEAIDLLIRAFCEPGQNTVMLMPPTYGMYKVSADINATETVQIPLDQDFQPDVNAVCQYLANHAEVKIIFLCSPNNPTANLMEDKRLEQLLNVFNGLLILDEAYIDFSDGTGWLNQLDQHPNLVILQTLSKAWGMAAVRLGMAFADPRIIDILYKIKPPYNVNGLTQHMALQALQNRQIYVTMVETIRHQKNVLINALEPLKQVKRIFPSDANFLLVRFAEHQQIYEQLMQNGIIVRDRSKMPGCQSCLRITVGTQEENNKLIQVLKEMES
ncbi:MAG: histidinol-phosphate transaminase [Caldithrix sp.]|nr:histidinol-phosphate transaminase [Caldithrix sp.]